jgi:hypothetical protein
MSKIKYLHFFGTSFTAGGGFEWGTYKKNNLNSFYGNIDCDKTEFAFSYPGQLQKLLGDKYIVKNWAKSGYGNDRLCRLAYDVINDPSFKTEEHLFLFEFAGLGRKELFFNPLNDYIILNYYSNKNNQPSTYAKGYAYDTDEERTILENEDKFFQQYTKLLVNQKNEVQNIDMMLDFFASFLTDKKINNIVLSGGLSSSGYSENLIGKNRIKLENNSEFIDINYYITGMYNLSITDETSSGIVDGHFGYYGNKLLAESIYNFLIDADFIKKLKIDIDYDFYKNVKVLKKTENLIKLI